MNSKWVFSILMIAAVILAWYPYVVSNHEVETDTVSPEIETDSVSHEVETDTVSSRIDNAVTPPHEHRTWRVFNTVAGGGHSSIGDKFRIQKTEDGYELVPLFKMLTNWKTEKRFSIPLIKPSAEEDRFCGMVEIPDHAAPEQIVDSEGTPKNTAHGPAHVFWVIWNDNDTVDIKWWAANMEAKDLKEQCMSQQYHGGLAHAEN